jgi:hypothetical protein
VDEFKNINDLIAARVEEDVEDANDAEAPREEDEDEFGGGMTKREIAMRISKGATKCIAGINEIELTNEFASLNLHIRNLDVGNVLAETDKEKIRRNRIEFEVRFSQIKDFFDGFEDMSEAYAKYVINQKDE